MSDVKIDQTTRVSREQAVEAAKRHEKRFPACKCLNGPNAEDDGPHVDCIMARFILQSQPTESQCRDFVRKCQETACVSYYGETPIYSVGELTAELMKLVGVASDDGVKRGWLCVGCGESWPDKSSAEKCYQLHPRPKPTGIAGTQPTGPN